MGNACVYNVHVIPICDLSLHHSLHTRTQMSAIPQAMHNLITTRRLYSLTIYFSLTYIYIYMYCNVPITDQIFAISTWICNNMHFSFFYPTIGSFCRVYICFVFFWIQNVVHTIFSIHLLLTVIKKTSNPEYCECYRSRYLMEIGPN